MARTAVGVHIKLFITAYRECAWQLQIIHAKIVKPEDDAIIKHKVIGGLQGD